MDIDKSKENIQPLRGGRNLHQLEAALQAQADHEAQRTLQAQKEEHETGIRNYEGPDPLDPWFNYIQWIEQCFPKHGHEGHIDKVIKECLQIFERDERYFQDRRFIKLWIKYIDRLSNPLEIYQRLYNSNIGVECSELYRAWACYCEESGDYKKANQVYMMGLEARAQPFDELQQAHLNFQLFFAQRMLHDDSPTKRKAASALAETRLALTSLRTFKRRNIASVASQRTGENVRSVAPGTVRQQPGAAPVHPASNIMVNVFEDGPSTSQVPAPAAEGSGAASLVQGFANVENEKEVGIWTKAKIKMTNANMVPHQPLSFTPYEDEDLILSPNHVAYCLDDLSTFEVPLCVPDPPDTTKIPCYNKASVYQDNTEYSLEEIRGRKNTNKKTTQAQSLAQAVSTPFNTSTLYSAQEASCSALETLANCALGSEHDLEQLMPLTIPTLQNITKVHNIHSPGEPKILVNLDSKEYSELANPGYRNSEEGAVGGKASRRGYADENKLAEDFNRSLVKDMHADVTVNTKEARWELRNLFTDNEPSMVQPIVQQFDVPNFDIHEDRSMTIALNTKTKLTLPEEEAVCLPEDKENAPKVFTVPDAAVLPNINKTAYYEEPSCTQVFNFNIKDASTPNMSQFKKPNIYADVPNKTPNVRKFLLDEGSMDTQSSAETATEKRDDATSSHAEHQAPGDNQGNHLSVIMESTREFNSKSSSGSSGMQSTRTMTGYTTRDSQAPYVERTQNSNLNYDSVYGNQAEAATSKRISICTQPRNANGQFAKSYTPKAQALPEHKVVPQTQVPYLHDHQYQKTATGYNGYTAQRAMQVHGYQQNYGIYPQAQAYSTPPVPTQQGYQVQQGYQSPSTNTYPSPQPPGQQSPHHMQSPTPTQPGFQSPQGSYHGYQSPGPAVPNSPHYQQEYTTTNHRPQVYAQQQNFQSPPHQTQYPNAHFQRNSANFSQSGYPQQNYNPDPYHNQSPYTNANHSFHSQNFNVQQNVYRQPPKQATDSHYAYANANSNQMSFQVYQSPNQSSDHNYQASNQAQSAATNQARPQPMQTSPSEPYPKQEYPNQNTSIQSHSYKTHPSEQHDQSKLQNRNTDIPHKETQSASSSAPMKIPTLSQSPAPYKSPTSILRSIRHEQQHGKPGTGTSDAGFSNQFLNFITSRNEPKDNANTPKFTNSPNISQKMHKNLYVSSPEQGQVPPSTSDSDSKDSLTARGTPAIQSAKTSVSDKLKDLSKRQLDFEHRSEYQSEDSRDSVSKESRISSVHSRHSMQSDGLGMDIDSENSMECAAYKSTHSISLIETHELPRPADIDFPKVIDPFNKKILNSLLEYVKFPNKTHSDGYVEVRSVPKMQSNTLVSVGNNKFSVEKQLGKGNYGAVFCCLDTINNKPVALKYQKPSRPWEFYICQEIKARIKDPFMLPGYMDIELAFLGENASIFVSELSRYGSLLDVANKIRVATSKCINEYIVLLLTSEMLSIIHYLHKAEIIHADIKPDNFLLMKMPAQEWRTPSLQLIDMGCSIDMSLFPEGTNFREMISTEGFTCTEMREGKPWTYQTDFYCLAGTIHVILLGSYMKIANRVGQWNIDKKYPRYMKSSNLWEKIFTTLLNVPDCNNLPDLMDLKSQVDEMLATNAIGDVLATQLRTFANVLKSR